MAARAMEALGWVDEGVIPWQVQKLSEIHRSMCGVHSSLGAWRWAHK